MYNGAFYKWNFDENKWVAAGTSVYAYIDYMTGISYEWNQTANEWQAKSQPPTPAMSTATASGKPYIFLEYKYTNQRI